MTLANWAAFETALAARFGGKVRSDAHGFLYRSGLTSGFTDGVLRTSASASELPELIGDVQAWFGTDVRWRWLVSALDRPPELATHLEARGFERRRVLPAMTRDLAGFDVNAHVRVDVTEVLDPADLAAWLSVRTANHPLDERTRDAWRVSQRDPSTDSPRQFVARDGGRPVGSATLFIDPETDTAGLYHVDVVPDARGRGIGMAVALVALDTAMRAGARWAVLTATDQGTGLYRRLGFEVVGEVIVFADAKR